MAIDTRELMKQVSRIRVITNRLVDERLSGEYHSVFKGQGIEFDEVREYDTSDDIRSIDWNVTARMGHPFVKRYSEERELTIMFLIDVSGSQCFGSVQRSKSEVAAEVACLLSLSAVKNSDKVGLILFSDHIIKSIPPRKGRKAVLRLVRDVLAAEDTREGTDIAGALQFLNSIQKRRAVVFLISDFQAQDFESQLRVTARRHDLICCPVTDPREMELFPCGVIEVQDHESGDISLLDTSNERVRTEFQAAAHQRSERLHDMFRKQGIDTISINTVTPFIDEVRRLFQQRKTRSGRP